MDVYKIIRKIKLPNDLLNNIISYYGNSIFKEELDDYYKKHKIYCPTGIYCFIEKMHDSIYFNKNSEQYRNTSICYLCGKYIHIHYTKNLYIDYIVKIYQCSYGYLIYVNDKHDIPKHNTNTYSELLLSIFDKTEYNKYYRLKHNTNKYDELLLAFLKKFNKTEYNKIMLNKMYVKIYCTLYCKCDF